MGETINRDEPTIKLENWRLIGHRLIGVVYNDPNLEDGAVVRLRAQSITLPTYLRDPYTNKGIPPVPLHAGVAVETPQSLYELGQEQDMPLTSIPIF